MENDKVLEKLKQINYPGFNRDIVSFGMVKDIIVDNDVVKLELSISSQNEEKKQEVIKSVKEKLSNIEYGLVKMRDEINVMNNQICNSLEQLSEITLESSNMITNELKSVDSSLKMNNLLQGIQVYQNYKTNRRLK